MRPIFLLLTLISLSLGFELTLDQAATAQGRAATGNRNNTSGKKTGKQATEAPSNSGGQMGGMQAPQADIAGAYQVLKHKIMETVQELRANETQCSESPIKIFLTVAANGSTSYKNQGENDCYLYLFDSTLSKLKSEDMGLFTVFGSPQQFEMDFGAKTANVREDRRYTPAPYTPPYAKPTYVPQTPSYSPYPTFVPPTAPPHLTSGTNQNQLPPVQGRDILRNGHFDGYSIAVNQTAPHMYKGWAKLASKGPYYWAYGVVHRENGHSFEITGLSTDSPNLQQPQNQIKIKPRYVKLGPEYYALPNGEMDLSK